MGFIVVGIDGSEVARRAFHEAVREAGWRKASILVVHTVPNPVTTGYEFAIIEPDRIHEGGEKLVADELEVLEAEYDGGFPVPVDQSVTIGHTGAAIIDAAAGGENGPADLVVLGTRGLGGFRGLVLGSVTTYAVHHLTCPLLIISGGED